MSSDLPKPGSLIHSAGREVGRLTSVVRSPYLGAVIAMGYVHRDFVEPGTTVEVTSPAGALTAEVSGLPFVPLALRLQNTMP
jgi:glycine cleavage system aminomethyltransferase T